MAKSRLWRLRRMNGQIDAELIDGEADGARLRITLDGELIYEHRFGDREQAVAEASRRLRELERGGWNQHW